MLAIGWLVAPLLAIELLVVDRAGSNSVAAQLSFLQKAYVRRPSQSRYPPGVESRGTGDWASRAFHHKSAEGGWGTRPMENSCMVGGTFRDCKNDLVFLGRHASCVNTVCDTRCLRIRNQPGGTNRRFRAKSSSSAFASKASALFNTTAVILTGTNSSRPSNRNTTRAVISCTYHCRRSSQVAQSEER